VLPIADGLKKWDLIREKTAMEQIKLTRVGQ